MASTGTEAWGGGRDFVPHQAVDQLTVNPTMMDDKIALPGLRLILGDYNGVDYKKTNTLEKACQRMSLHARIYAEAAKLFDAVVAAQLAQTPAGTTLLDTDCVQLTIVGLLPLSQVHSAQPRIPSTTRDRWEDRVQRGCGLVYSCVWRDASADALQWSCPCIRRAYDQRLHS